MPKRPQAAGIDWVLILVTAALVCARLLWMVYRGRLEPITGMAAATLQPAAGAHGELTALMVAAAYFRDRGEKRGHFGG